MYKYSSASCEDTCVQNPQHQGKVRVELIISRQTLLLGRICVIFTKPLKLPRDEQLTLSCKYTTNHIKHVTGGGYFAQTYATRYQSLTGTVGTHLQEFLWFGPQYPYHPQYFDYQRLNISLFCDGICILLLPNIMFYKIFSIFVTPPTK